MKKMIQIFAVLLVLAMASAAQADSLVAYMDQEKLFAFEPGSEYSATDLFENYKNVLPGDVLTQRVYVINESQADVRISLCQAPQTFVTTDAEDFLEQLWLTVKHGGQTLFDAPASESAQLTEGVLLGFFPANEYSEVVLDVTLRVPANLGNEYMGQIGYVPWTFIVEEIPDDDSPHTGDWYENTVWLAMAGALVLAIAFVLVLMRRRKEAE